MAKRARNLEQGTFLERLYRTSPRLLRAPQINRLIRVYLDVEETLKELRRTATKSVVVDGTLHHIDVRKLISQLSKSKRRLERKIGNTLLLEKQALGKKWRNLASGMRHAR